MLTDLEMKFSYYFIVLLFLCILSSCNYCESFGSYELGSNLVLLDGDRLEDRIIVRCTNRSSGCCGGGEYILPTYEEHYNLNGKYREYVLQAKSDEKWIIVQTKIIEDDVHRYWFIDKSFSVDSLDCYQVNCSEVILENRFGPFSKSDFSNLIKIKEIQLVFD